MALSADRMTPKQSIFGGCALPVYTETTIYAGSLVMVKSDGYAYPASNSATSNVVMGVAKKTVKNTAAAGGSGASGAKWVEVEWGIFDFAATSISQASVGLQMMVVDDQTFDETGTNSVECGVCVELYPGSTTRGKIFLQPGGTL
jgi:hypothetical protein